MARIRQKNMFPDKHLTLGQLPYEGLKQREPQAVPKEDLRLGSVMNPELG